MRINEDFIDDQSVQDVITSDDEPLSMTYPYSFFFKTMEIDVKLPADSCIQMLAKFCAIFTRMVEGLPAVKHFNKNYFRIYMGGTYIFDDFDSEPEKPLIRHPYNTIIIPGGFKVHFTNEDGIKTFDDFFYNANFITSFGFFINIDANMETISQIQKMWLTIWTLFEKAIKLSFGLNCKPMAIYYYDDGINIFDINVPYLAHINLDAWKGETNLSKITLTRALRQYNQDLNYAEAEHQVTDFISHLKK